MEFVEGRIFRDLQLSALSVRDRAAVYDSMNDSLARLHNVDFRAVGLEDFGKPGNYFERQIGRWTKQYRGAETEHVDSMEKLIEWLPSNVPPDESSTITHGDFRLENSIYHPTEPRMIAILDWELSTIGHPLADLAYNCMPYHIMNPSIGGLVGVDFERTGIPSESEYVARYCERTNRAGIENWDFYIAFSIFRLASISQGVYKRGLDGNASSAQATTFKDICRLLSDMAWRTLEGARGGSEASGL
jgi:aminoglycoside phosphotransferase (APT) family kinase protein